MADGTLGLAGVSVDCGGRGGTFILSYLQTRAGRRGQTVSRCGSNNVADGTLSLGAVSIYCGWGRALMLSCLIVGCGDGGPGGSIDVDDCLCTQQTPCSTSPCADLSTAQLPWRTLATALGTQGLCLTSSTCSSATSCSTVVPVIQLLTGRYQLLLCSAVLAAAALRRLLR